MEIGDHYRQRKRESGSSNVLVASIYAVFEFKMMIPLLPRRKNWVN